MYRHPRRRYAPVPLPGLQTVRWSLLVQYDPVGVRSTEDPTSGGACPSNLGIRRLVLFIASSRLFGEHAEGAID